MIQLTYLDWSTFHHCAPAFKEKHMNIKPLLTLSIVTALSFAATGVAIAGPSNGVLVRQDGIYLRCDQCGTVQGVQHNVTQGRNSGTAGAIIGAVAGGVLGNQIGKGNGRTIATVGGAVGGGFAGNAIGKGGGSDTWVLNLRMGNGTYTNIQVKDASTIRQGDLVEVDSNGNVTRIQ
jgi:outer membrane lipoprotein SlyB